MEQIDLIISQGPLNHYEEVEKAWAGVAPVLHSCWVGDSCAGNRFILRSQPPPYAGPQNVFMQQKSVLVGLYWAKRNGYKRVMKIRSDLLPTNAAEFIKLQTGELNFLFAHLYNGGYLVDYLQSGETDLLIDLWEFTETPDFPEQAITKTFFEKGLCDKDVQFIGQHLTKENDLYWIKNDKFISEYNKDPLFITKKYEPN